MEKRINFTKEHEEKLNEFIVEMWREDIVVIGKLGQPMNICELKVLSPNSLNDLKLIYDKKISSLESKDEWIDPENDKLDLYRFIRNGLNLLVGFKRKQIQIAEAKAKKAELTKKLTELKESTKTPEDRIKEMEAALAELDEF
jgi:hypothetical protein